MGKYYDGDECWNVIENLGYGEGFNLGNAMKYIWRCNRKENKIQDLKKAIDYLNREISRCELDEERKEAITFEELIKNRNC